MNGGRQSVRRQPLRVERQLSTSCRPITPSLPSVIFAARSRNRSCERQCNISRGDLGDPRDYRRVARVSLGRWEVGIEPIANHVPDASGVFGDQEVIEAAK